MPSRRRIRPSLVALEPRALLAVFTVTSLADAGPGTLRQAILDANTNYVDPADAIRFLLPGTGPQVIRPSTALPTLSHPTTIDGYTQPGSRPNASATGDDAVIFIQLDGPARGFDGLTIAAAGCTVRGISTTGFGDGIHVLASATGTRVVGDFIGLDPTGHFAGGSAADGLFVDGASAVVVGGPGPGDRVVASANGGAGVRFLNAASPTVQGSYFGTDAGGVSGLGNKGDGLRFENSPHAAIGGAGPGEGVLVAGNGGDGIRFNDETSGYATVLGSLIGTDVTGTYGLGNNNGVVWFSPSITIGGAAPGEGNLVSGNRIDGLVLFNYGRPVASATIQGNRIGVIKDGSAALPNAGYGINLDGASAALVGGTGPGAGNLISGNLRDGLYSRSSGNPPNALQGNLIGTDATGLRAVPNGGNGVLLGDSRWQVGGTGSTARNVISGNRLDGLHLQEPIGYGSAGNVVQGNLIGLGVDGATPLGNAGIGVSVGYDAVDTTVGGTAAGAGNVIAHNAKAGVAIGHPSATSHGNSVVGNAIFANGGLGIDLGGDGVTPNHPFVPGARPSGPNDFQNYPVLTSAAVDPASGALRVTGTLDAAPSSTYAIDLYANPAVDPSGHGPGQLDLGTRTITTDTAGHAFFALSVANPAGEGLFLAATATDSAGSTSEFSADLPVRGAQILAVTTVADAGPGSLRQAILDANAGTGAQFIQFAIPGAGVHTIAPTSALPVITASARIDGDTQGGARPNRLAVGSDAVITVMLSGVNAGAGVDALVLAGGPCTVRGLAIGDFNGDALVIRGAGGHTLSGCFLGVSAGGVVAAPNRGAGILIDGSPDNTIGGPDVADTCVISANGDTALTIQDAHSTGNVIEGDLIGTDATGEAAMGNGTQGITIQRAPGNRVGVVGGRRNVISATKQAGIVVIGAGADGNAIANNFIGTDAAGAIAFGNALDGIYVSDGTDYSPPSPGAPTGTIIGGQVAGAGNVISANGDYGIWIRGNVDATIQGNKVGTDATGTRALGNKSSGILVGGDTPIPLSTPYPLRVLIGGAQPGMGNLISANVGSGVLARGTDVATADVEGNTIGTDPAGVAALGNLAHGVDVDTANITVGGFGFGTADDQGGGPNFGSGNLISGNAQSGIYIHGTSRSATVQGNRIGTDITGTRAVGNGVGITVAGSHPGILYGEGVLIGGRVLGVGNTIGGNRGDGIDASNLGVASLAILTDSIGTDPSGQLNLGNGGDGVRLSGTSGALVGSRGTFLNNIAHNALDGVDLTDGPTLPTADSVLSNNIFDNGRSSIGVSPGHAPSPPTISAAYIAGDRAYVRGSVVGRPGYPREVDFFLARGVAPDGRGQGNYDFNISVTPDTTGYGYFQADIPLPGDPALLSATATDFEGRTSTFSAPLATSVKAAASTPPADYDGDGKADLSVYRPTTGQWLIARSTTGPYAISFGSPGLDVPVRGDFDGDGREDIAVYRPTTGQWLILRSTAGPADIPFGGPGDVPVPADYDGDGVADLAVYRPSTGQWLIRRSTAGPVVIPFGGPGLDQPVPADYDGDGKADVAVYRKATGQWLLLGTTSGPRAVAFGAPNLDVPVPADYDGDGKADLAVFRPTTAQWLIQRSTAGPVAVAFGGPGLDQPVPADYDGDGRADVAVYRKSTGRWLIAGSTAGPRVVAFGQPAVDAPVPSPLAYRYQGGLPPSAVKSVRSASPAAVPPSTPAAPPKVAPSSRKPAAPGVAARAKPVDPGQPVEAPPGRRRDGRLVPTHAHKPPRASLLDPGRAAGPRRGPTPA